MATEIDDEAKGCTFQWKIENMSHCWCLYGGVLESPSFIADGLESTKWTLQLYYMGNEKENSIGFYLQREKDCSGPDEIRVNFELAFLGKDGSLLTHKTILEMYIEKEDSKGFIYFEERKRIFVTEREAFLPEDTLTVQCTIWITNEKPVKSNRLFATTVIKIKRRSFLWRIDEISTHKSDLRRKFIDYLIGFDLVLKDGFDKLDISVISFDESVKYISCNTSIIDSDGKKENCGIQKYFYWDLKKEGLSHVLLLPKTLMENKSRFFPNDVLSLDFEFVFTTFEHFDYRKNYNLEKEVAVKEKSYCTAVLIDEYKSMYNDGIFSDTELRTSTKTFPAHKAILSARSSVFSRMFTNDMKEASSGHVDITDFEDDTIHRMLLYIYTASLEDLQLESASKLYAAADKYQILSLKSRCSSFLIVNLCPTNACDTLVLADLHHDDDLKSAVQNYMLGQRKQFFCSQEWKDFMNTHNKLASDIMYRKITKSRISP